MTAKDKLNKEIQSLKQGFQDVQLVSQEGNFKLFAKQVVLVGLVAVLFMWVNDKFDAQKRNLTGQIDAIRVQQTNEREYSSSKNRLLELEPRFPDMADKNEWLVNQIMSTFKDQNLTPVLDGSQQEDTSNPSYLVASYSVSVTAPFQAFGELLAAFENKSDYVKLSKFDLSKVTENDQLGQNKITLTVNTVFPKEKLAAKLFKDVPAGGNK